MRIIPQQDFDAYPSGYKKTFRKGRAESVTSAFGKLLKEKGLVIEDRPNPPPLPKVSDGTGFSGSIASKPDD